MSLLDVAIPDIGEFESVEVIEVLVSVGDRVEVEQSLITLESDKATMEIPCPSAGEVRELCVEVGSQVSQGDLIVKLEVAGDVAAAEEGRAAAPGAVADPSPSSESGGTPVEAAGSTDLGAESGSASAGAEATQAAPITLPDADMRAEVLVLGSGPGGYTAAFRAADLGKNVVLVEKHASLGGVCLNVGCIPSKALLHLSEAVTGAKALADHGVEFGAPKIDLDKIRSFKESVVNQLTGGLAGLAKRRGVEVVQGTGRLEGPHLLRVEGAEGERTIAFEHAILAPGSRPVEIPDLPNDDPRLLDSTSALALEDVPGRLLIIGGGIIGLELASVYHGLGSKVTVVELLDQLMTGADPDLVKPLQRIIADRYENIFTGTRVTAVEAGDAGLRVSFEGKDAPDHDTFDRVLVAVGRIPNGGSIGAELAGVAVDERGFIAVDAQMRTNIAHIFAIGDVVGNPMLAHKATHQGKTAAEVIAGHKAAFEPATIPSVAYTDPEIAWAGLTEVDAKARGVEYKRVSFPWAASGRALGIARSEGHTKLLVEPETRRILGGGIVGPHAGDLIAEIVLALEMGADAEDLSLTIHPHPTLSESVAFAAEMAEGTITDLYIRKR